MCYITIGKVLFLLKSFVSRVVMMSCLFCLSGEFSLATLLEYRYVVAFDDIRWTQGVPVCVHVRGRAWTCVCDMSIEEKHGCLRAIVCACGWLFGWVWCGEGRYIAIPVLGYVLEYSDKERSREETIIFFSTRRQNKKRDSIQQSRPVDSRSLNKTSSSRLAG